MALKLHRCRFDNPLINKLPGHSCGRVEKALDKMGIEYERVRVISRPQSARSEVFELSGQYVVPMIEFEDGSVYRAESKEMAAEIRAGRLNEHKGNVPGSAS